MTIPPQNAKDQEKQKIYAQLHQALEQLKTNGVPLDTLSMGMTDDYPLAIKEGATIIRIGTGIFGPRT